MISIKEVIVVEGRYDKNTLSQIVDATIVETSGFAKVAMYYEVPTVVNETNKTEYYKRLVIANFDELYKTIVDAQ